MGTSHATQHNTKAAPSGSTLSEQPAPSHAAAILAGTRAHKAMSTGPNPSGLCMCGCGQPAPVAKLTNTRRGHVKGEPVRFIYRHQPHKQALPDAPPNPSGLCQCGCGQQTGLAHCNDPRRGHLKGQPVRYITGHHTYRSPVRYVVNETTGCWEWTGFLYKGYGQVTKADRKKRAHRAMYEELVGPIPEGLELDHLCRNRACVNPAHLEPVTHDENIRRARAAGKAIAA